MKDFDWKCDKCGRFAKREVGASIVFIPDSEVTYEELRFRCKTCTDKYGKIYSSQTVNDDSYSWIIGG